MFYANVPLQLYPTTLLIIYNVHIIRNCRLPFTAVFGYNQHRKKILCFYAIVFFDVNSFLCTEILRNTFL